MEAWFLFNSFSTAPCRSWAIARTLECFTALLEAVDPAVQVPPDLSRRLAQQLETDIGRWLPRFGTETKSMLPLQSHCCERNSVLSRYNSLQTKAVILHTTGPFPNSTFQFAAETELVKDVVYCCGIITEQSQANIFLLAPWMNHIILWLFHCVASAISFAVSSAACKFHQ